VDVMRGEMVEGELDRLIERRSRQKDPAEENELWQESVRRYNRRRQEEHRLEWHTFHCGQAERLRATLESLLTYHEEQAQRLLEDGPKGDAA